ncbi:hypothetical protein [Chondromyces crocatus]|uniref:hypothetical protein n=1 Tax=Chondromyces crocatus TaxID=52 RepID=UPI001FE1D606|nr:hypothetical protein [Chondromyces crocatus]
MLAKIVSDDGLAAAGTRVIPWVGEARQALEQDFQLEECLFFFVRCEAREPGLTRLLLLTPQASRVAEELGISITYIRGRGIASRQGGVARHGGPDQVRGLKSKR